MELSLPTKPGTYVVAVSGGIDSVCLLDLLAKEGRHKLIISHFNHGIRNDSHLDVAFVRSLSKKYKLPLVVGLESLGANASEEKARQARYAFLFDTMKAQGASSIITAHHLDDRLETMFINIIRGTGRRGLASIQESEYIKRPLLKYSKDDLKEYARIYGLKWREDSTNSSDKYLRNYIRHNVLTKLDKGTRDRLIALMDDQTVINQQIDQIMNGLLEGDSRKLRRRILSNLSFVESEELIASWLRQNNLFNFDRMTIERLTLASKTKRPGTKLDVFDGNQIRVEKEYLALVGVER